MKKYIFVSFIFLMSLQQLSAQNRSKFRVNYSNSEQNEKSFNTISFAKNGGKDQYSITTESEKSYNDKFDISKIKSITRDREINISVLEGDELNNAIHDAIISENSIDEIIQSLKTNVNIDEVIKDHSKNILVLEKGDSVYTVFPTVDYEDPFNDDENENLSRAIASRTSWKETGKYGKVAVFNYFSGMSERKGQNGMVEDLMSLLNEHDYGVEYYDYDHFTKENLDKVINDSKYNNAYKAVLIFSHGFVNDGEGKHNGYPDDPWIVLGEEYKRSKHGAKMAENERYKWYNFESRNNGAYRVKEIDCNRSCILYIGACNALEGYHKGDKYCPVIGWDGVNVLSQAHALMIFHRMLNNEASLVNALKSTWSFDKIVESDWVSSVVSDNTNGIFFLGNPDKDYGYSLYNVVSKVYLDKPGTDEIFFRRGNPIDLYPSYKLKFQGHITYEGDDCPKRLWVRIKPVGRKGTGINAKLKIKKDGSFDSSMKLSNGMNGMYDIIIGEKKDFGLNEIVEMESYRTFVYSSKFKENSASTLDYFSPDHIDIIDDNNSKVSSLSLKQGESKTLHIDDDDPEEKYLVSSSDPTVARVSVEGTKIVIEAIGRGSSFITVNDEEEYVTSTINVNVDEGDLNDNIKTFTINGVSFNMVKVDGGSFMMGTDDKEASSDARYPHQVYLDSYLIGQTEVTQGLWEAVMGNNPSRFKGINHPVESISWDDCQLFIEKMNQLTGLKFRLPTEAEWEYAAKGGSMSKGYKYSGSDNIDDVAWYRNNAYLVGIESPEYGSHAVCTKKPNELGIYDMTGNVTEFCYDWYDEKYYRESPQSNPSGPVTPGRGLKAHRGGYWESPDWICKNTYRDYGWPDARTLGTAGLRLALSIVSVSNFPYR